MAREIFLVINPRARSGQGKKEGLKIVEIFTAKKADFTFEFTAHPRHAVELAANARRQGCKTVVAVGGDGTICETVTGLFSAPGELPLPKLGVIHTGTSPDFNKHHGIPFDIAAAIEVILRGMVKTIDVARIDYYKNPDQTGAATAFFVSNTNVGLGPLIVSRTNSRYRKYLGDFLGTLTAMLVSLAGFKPASLTLTVDGQTMPIEALINLTIGKDPYIGSGMRIFNDVAPADGRAYVFIAVKTSWRRFIVNLPKIYTGNFLDYDGARIVYGRMVEVSGCPRYPLLECDGDIKGYLPAKIEILPKALDVLM